MCRSLRKNDIIYKKRYPIKINNGFFFPYRENLFLELITSKSKMIKAFCNKNCMFEFVKDLPIKNV